MVRRLPSYSQARSLSVGRGQVMDSDKWRVVGGGWWVVGEGWWVVGGGPWVVRVVWGWFFRLYL